MKPSLPMRAWTQRNTGATDPYGGGETWVDQLLDEPCHWWVTSGREQIDQTRSVALAEEHCLFARGADVAAGDRIRRLVDHEGRTVFDAADAAGRAREVEHVAVQRKFLDASLRSTT